MRKITTMSFVMAILGLFSTGTTNKMSGAEAIVTDYQERQNLKKDGKQTTGFLIEAERLVEEGVFHDNAVAQLWFDLGKYGRYPVTLDLPEGPGQENELESFLGDLGNSVEDLEWMVEEQMAFPFIRYDGEWVIDWDDIKSAEEFEEE